MSTTIRIGTRDSKLAVWQANLVKQTLENLGHVCSLVYVKAEADRDLSTPLHQFGGTGIFTKILDDALLEERADIAVHSLKDYPTQSPDGLLIAAVLERGSPMDIIVYKDTEDFLRPLEQAIVATGSIRRIAQWKNKFPQHQTTGLRGNVQTRLRKLDESDWNGAIFAKAGLERINLLPENHKVLDWMIPAPAQGIIGIGCRAKDQSLISILKQVNHDDTSIAAQVERQFLNTAEGGCSAPIGAYAFINDGNVYLKAGIFEPDGSDKAVIEMQSPVEGYTDLGKKAALKALKEGGKKIMQKIKKHD